MAVAVQPRNYTAPSAAPRRVSILGVTGSVGATTANIIERHGGEFAVEAVTAHTNAARLAEQALRLRPRFAALGDPARYGELRDALSGTGIEVAAGAEALVEAAGRPADWVMAAIVGAAGLGPTMAAIQQGSVVALANKEVLVCAGDLVMAEVRRSRASLLPVDSEHNAIYQVFAFDSRESIDRIILTASGGPFRQLSLEQMAQVTPSQAVEHPNWSMGRKISVDCATMVNKGLELIEAHHLFGLREQDIDILVHPQSVVHGLVEYSDGSVLAQLGSPDMSTPIAYTLAWPRRMATETRRFDLASLGNLTFERPDESRFPALRTARDALRTGGSAPTILNAANEVAVDGFMAGQVGFLDIARIVDATLDAVSVSPVGSLEDVLQTDATARRVARELLRRV